MNPYFGRGAVVLALLAAGCITAPAGINSPPALAQAIEATRAPAEHEALARYYEQRATDARRQAEEHGAMRKSYEYSTFAHRYQKSGHIPVMERHCDALIRNGEENARIWSQMAEQHRQWARQAAETGDP